MTKKDFEAIARVIQEHKIWDKHPGFVRDLAKLFEEENPRFDIFRFLNASRHHEK